MMMQNNFPKLRFIGFDDEWEHILLRDIAYIYDGTHQTPNYVKNGIKFVSVENIADIQSTDKFITPEAFNKNFKIKPQKGDILMTRITAGIIGATSIVANNDPLGYYVSLALIRKKGNIDVDFLNQTINSHYFKHELHKRIIHVAFPKKINLGDIGECKASFPSLPEQTKIASFLIAVDQKISLLKHKKTLLEQYKKGLMQKIFAQEIRFKDENGKDYPNWEKKKLGEVFAQRSEKGYNDYELLSVTINEGVKSRTDIEGKDNSSDDKSNYKRVVKNDIVYNSMRMWQGASGVTYKDGIVSPAYTVLKGNKENNSEFFAYMFKMKFMIQVFQRNSQGLTSDTWNLKYPQLSTIKVKVPSLKEQTRFANFLIALDEKINHCQKQIEKTEHWKKGLLQKMFV